MKNFLLKSNIFSYLTFLIVFIPLVSLEGNTNELISSLKWEKVNSESFFDDFIKNYQYQEDFKQLKKIAKKKPNSKIRATGRNITINNILYPEISNYVPNAFVQDPHSKFNFSTRLISKTRSSTCKGSVINCGDGILNISYGLLNTENASFSIDYTIQSLSSRRKGTKIGEGQSMGFKLAKEINPKWSVALGGDHIIHFDESTDLGRNFYLISSHFYSFNKSLNSPKFFVNFGIGSDFFGYKGNGNLGQINCIGNNTLTRPGSTNCNIGIITSASIIFNENLGLVTEWFGYGFGLGVSTKPLKNFPMTVSLYATDFLGDTPGYINDGNSSKCSDSICETRFYGNISFSF